MYEIAPGTRGRRSRSSAWIRSSAARDRPVFPFQSGYARELLRVGGHKYRATSTHVNLEPLINAMHAFVSTKYFVIRTRHARESMAAVVLPA
jgi:hypothetical protein